MGRGAECADALGAWTARCATGSSSGSPGLYDFPRTSVPFKRARRYFFMHNTGLQDQPVLYVQEGAGRPAACLIDPNAMSA